MSDKNILVELNKAGFKQNNKWLVEGVSLKVEKGKIVTLIGPNGSGKSTTAKIALGIYKDIEGSVKKYTNKVGYVPQKISIDWTLPLRVHDFMTLTENINDDAINEALIILRKIIEIENIHIQIDVPIEYKVIGVSNELSQVIINLIQNSKDAFIQNDITNRTIIITLKEKQILDKKYALLEIKDNAGGISKENIEKIFDPYFTTKYKSQGTGLGLFMSKMIIEKSLEGELSHRNSNDGSTFIIKLILG